MIFIGIGFTCLIVAVLLLAFDKKEKPAIAKEPAYKVEDAIAFIEKNVSANVASFTFVEVNDAGEYVFDFIDENRKTIQLVVDLKNKKTKWVSSFGGVE